MTPFQNQSLKKLIIFYCSKAPNKKEIESENLTKKINEERIFTPKNDNNG